VEDAGGGAGVDEPVEELPAAPQPPDPPAHGREGKRHHQDERRHAGRDVGTLDDVGPDVREGERLIEHDVHEEVERGVEEGEQPEHPPVLHGPLPAGQPPDRGHRERQHQEPQRPDARRQRDRLDRVHAATSLPRAPFPRAPFPRAPVASGFSRKGIGVSFRLKAEATEPAARPVARGMARIARLGQTTDRPSSRSSA
jgi:hypothetical protein